MTHVDWHPYPDEMPDSGKDYLVTVENRDGVRRIEIAHFMYLTAWLGLGAEYVVAWAEQPEPYKEPELLDMHQDAITARKYMEGDPETVKALHIFDEE